MMKMSNESDLKENCILQALSSSEYDYLIPHIELVEMFKGEILFEADSTKSQYVYFPTTAVVSLLCYMEDGATVEVATIGREGILGISAILGGEGLNRSNDHHIRKIVSDFYTIIRKCISTYRRQTRRKFT